MKPSDFITPANVLAHGRGFRRRYPHMGPADRLVWQEVLKLGLVKADRFEYDVRLGGSLALFVEDSHTLRPMWESLLRKRVDVVAWTGSKATVIEVKPVASFAALGQCLGYAWLWNKEKRTPGKVSAVCACAIVDPDLKPVFDFYGVGLVSLPMAEAEKVLTPRYPRADQTGQ